MMSLDLIHAVNVGKMTLAEAEAEQKKRTGATDALPKVSKPTKK